MKRRFTAAVWVHDGGNLMPCAFTHSVRELGHYRSEEGARRRVRRWLDARPVYETRALPDDRAPWGEVWRDGVSVAEEEPRTILVPSVGERGFW